jgi:hypothetical protein
VPTRKSHRSKPPHRNENGIRRVAARQARLGALFKVLGDASGAGDRALLGVAVPEDEETAAAIISEARIFARAINGLKAVRLLCEQGHWE